MGGKGAIAPKLGRRTHPAASAFGDVAVGVSLLFVLLRRGLSLGIGFDVCGGLWLLEARPFVRCGLETLHVGRRLCVGVLLFCYVLGITLRVGWCWIGCIDGFV